MNKFFLGRLSRETGGIWVLWLGVFILHVLYYDVTWFSIDQARDLIQASRIAAAHEFPLNGPLMHWIAHIGPLYYYVLALPLFVYSNPAAVYFFIALMATATVMAGFYFLQHFFDTRTGVIFVALYVPSAFVLIDSRALWTPAFLPFFTVLALFAMAQFFCEKRQFGMIALAVFVGVGSQFHLSFILMLPLFLVTWMLIRIPVRWTTLAMSLAVGVLTYLPYLYYQMTHNWADLRAFVGFAIQTTPSAAVEVAPLLTRTINYLVFPAYFADLWLHLPGIWLWIFEWTVYAHAALLVVSVIYLLLIASGIVKAPGSNSRLLGMLLGWYIGVLFILLRRSADLYYYYFDLSLPIPFFLVSIFLSHGWSRLGAGVWKSVLKVSAVGLLFAYVLVQAGGYCYWIVNTRREGLYRLSLEALDLHRIHRTQHRPEDAFMVLKAKKEIARLVTRGWGWSRSDAYQSLLGSRFYDCSEDRGYWLNYYQQAGSEPLKEQPMVIWHRSDPMERWAARLNLRTRALGSFRFASVDPSVLPARWELPSGTSISLPVRTVPEVGDYGFVPAHRWEMEPLTMKSAVVLDRKPAQYVLVVITKGDRPALSLEVNSRRATPQETNRTIMTSEHFFDLGDALNIGNNHLTLSFSGGRDFDLEAFGWVRP